MSVEKKLVQAGLIVSIGYTVYNQPFATAFTTLGVASILYGLTRSPLIVLGWIVVGALLGGYNRLFARRPEPVGVSEAFQAKDPVSVHTRLAQVKNEAPLAPKVPIANVTGVLESPSILDNTPLMAMDRLAQEGVPGASIPSSAKARVLIYPPAEESVPAPTESRESPLRDAPYLQAGPDREGEGVAMIPKGAGLPAPDVEGSEMGGVSSGAGPAF